MESQQKPSTHHDNIQVLIFQHSTGSPPGSCLLWLKERDIPYQIHFWGRDQIQPDLASADWLIILGGGQNVDEENKYPWLKEEKKLIQQALQTGKTILGLCLGGQLIAEALGGDVRKHKHWEVGWHEIQIDPRCSPLLPKHTTSLMAFHWHGYCFHVPQECLVFAHNEVTSQQGFTYGDRVVATQFHPESECSWVEECTSEETELYPTGPFVQSPEEIRRSMGNQPELQRWFYELLANMLAATRKNKN